MEKPECEVCCQLMFQPTAFPCRHTFCGACYSALLDTETPVCPLCRRPVPPGLDYDREQDERVKAAFPAAHLARTQQLLAQHMKFYIGNTAQKAGRHGYHDWTLYLRPFDPSFDLKAVVKTATVTLHPTFPNPVRTMDKDLELKTSGWGVFEISIHI
jgi:hypothetical protein